MRKETRGEESGERVEAVEFDELQSGDVLMIRTENSEYRFSVKDPLKRVGTLMGGRINGSRDAVLSGAMEGMKEFWSGGVRRGTRALFFMMTPMDRNGFNRILTSAVKSIELWRGSGRQAA